MSDPSHTDAEHGSIAIVVLGCASPPYVKTIETIRQTWGSTSFPGIDTYYVYGIPHRDQARNRLSGMVGRPLPDVAPDGLIQLGDILLVGCADMFQVQVDCLLRKRLTAFDYLSRSGKYDWIYTVCATSYVGLEGLMRRAESLPRRPFVSGAISIDPSRTAPFVSGASMLMTVDVAAGLGRARDAIIAGNQFRQMDDVTIGHWVATHMSNLSIESAVSDIVERRGLPSDYILIPGRETTRDYVTNPPESHLPAPNAFHYHFNSRRPEDMSRFHERYRTRHV